MNRIQRSRDVDGERGMEDGMSKCLEAGLSPVCLRAGEQTNGEEGW